MVRGRVSRWGEGMAKKNSIIRIRSAYTLRTLLCRPTHPEEEEVMVWTHLFDTFPTSIRKHFLPYPKLENLFFLWTVVQTNFLIKITVQKTNILPASAFITIQAGGWGRSLSVYVPYHKSAWTIGDYVWRPCGQEKKWQHWTKSKKASGPAEDELKWKNKEIHQPISPVPCISPACPLRAHQREIRHDDVVGGGKHSEVRRIFTPSFSYCCDPFVSNKWNVFEYIRAAAAARERPKWMKKKAGNMCQSHDFRWRAHIQIHCTILKRITTEANQISWMHEDCFGWVALSFVTHKIFSVDELCIMFKLKQVKRI